MFNRAFICLSLASGRDSRDDLISVIMFLGLPPPQQDLRGLLCWCILCMEAPRRGNMEINAGMLLSLRICSSVSVVIGHADELLDEDGAGSGPHSTCT
jgi:hypothetical protein